MTLSKGPDAAAADPFFRIRFWSSALLFVIPRACRGISEMVAWYFFCNFDVSWYIVRGEQTSIHKD